MESGPVEDLKRNMNEHDMGSWWFLYCMVHKSLKRDAEMPMS